MEKFLNEIEKLISGEITEIEVTREDFFSFREAWVNHAKKDFIIGEARLGGSVIYTYSEPIK